MEDKEEKFVGIKDNTNKYTRKIFDSPSSKARILTPVKNALHKSNGRTNEFLKTMQNIVAKKDKENIYNEANIEENIHIEKSTDDWVL